MMQGNGNIYSLLVSMKIGAATQEISGEVPQKAENRSTTRCSNATLGHVLRGLYISHYRNYLLLHVQSGSTHNSQKWAQPRSQSTGEWVTYTMKCYSVVKNKICR